MHATLALASLASLASVALAQIPTGYGRFPCTLVNGDGTFSADPNQCLDAALINPAGGADPTQMVQGAEPNPTGAACSIELETGAYFCGIAGADCSSDDNCDNGTCDLASGTCQGGFLQDCGGEDSNCSGFLYCNNADLSQAFSCGEDGAYCQDPYATNDGQTAAEQAAVYDQFCSSGYCSNVDANCAQRFTLGQDCSADIFGCGTTDAGVQLTCVDNAGVQTCQVEGASPAAGRSRSRRASLHRRNLCPASHTACAVEGAAKGFECIDISSNIEQCGACASAGGVDCTAIEGVAAVGCVAGTCEIWSCEDGFTYDAATGACTSA